MRKVYILLSLGILSLFSSCDKYLEEAPDKRIVPKTVDELAAMLVYAYNEETYNFIEFKTDNVTAIPANTQVPWLTENYTWQPVLSNEAQDTPANFWRGAYKAIAHSNQVLAYLNQVEGDKEYLQAVEGEALVTRAYNHFLLASVFCEIYDFSTASGKLGIPYIKKPETKLEVSYPRGTLEETYQNIKSDLERGLPLLSGKYYQGTGKYHFTPQAGYAFASRFYLFMKDYDKCIQYSDKLLGENALDENYIRDFNTVFTGTTPKEIANKFINPELPSNLLLERKNTGRSVLIPAFGYQANSEIFTNIYTGSLQGGVDFRNKSFGPPSLGVNSPKYTELLQVITNNSLYLYFIMPVLRSEEVIFNRMEAYVHKGMYDRVLNDYNALAPYRYKNGGQLTEDKILNYYGKSKEESYKAFVLEERRKEFIREGIRWWDIRRNNIEITHTDVSGKQYQLSANDPKAVEQIPYIAIQKGIEPNPR